MSRIEEVTTRTRMAFTVRSFLLRLALSTALVLFFALLSRAGGPKCVAGTSYFDSTMTGVSLLWPLGTITYYSDQGDLSPIVPNTAATALVAEAFSQWTSVPTAALSAASGGQLAEDVNGTNVIVNADGTISIPADIQPTATGTPIGIVYDYDGSVTSALLGSGAGDASQCFSNAAFGGNDNYGSFATYQHALIVINGQCAQQSSQLTDLEYRLVRAIGSVLGIGWSQLNPNVITGNPYPTSDDYAGFPVMHFKDPRNCVPITRCYANPYRLSMDDAATLSRLYPVTEQNQSSFTDKQVFATSTARIHGSVWFTDKAGNRTSPMQGVNVVARWIDPTTNQPSRKYAASAVSGFLFTGNEGNPITGFDDELGDAYSEWGSIDPSVEGFFDLAGLQLPNGGSAQYQLSVEALDPNWSGGVGPYAPWLVAPSGSAQPILVTVAAGQDVQQDIFMKATAQPVPIPPSSWVTPTSVPGGGDWMGSLHTFDDVSYFLLPAQADRTLSIAVTALDEAGNPSESKLQPVIGMWAAVDPEGTQSPAFTPSPFNTSIFGMTRLDAQIAQSTNFLIGLSDVRGDGRPDYRYKAHVLYGNSASPSRLGIAGGAVSLQGTGFGPGMRVSVGSGLVTQLAISTGQIIVTAPAFGDGAQSITIADPVSGSSSVMTNALTFGAAESDNILLLTAINPSTPVGAQAINPVRVQVLQADAVTPVGGATVGWSATNGLLLSACNNGSSCTITTDQSGSALTWLTPATVGVSNVTATLAPGVYSPAKSVTTTLNAIQSSSDIGVLTPYLWIAQGATVTTPLTARVLSNGLAQSNVRVNFFIETGAGTLSAASAQTNSNGYATVMLTASQMAALVQVSACVAPANAPCQPFYANPVPLSQLRLQPVSGIGQLSTGLPFQPVVLRVVDSSSPPNPVLGATVVLQTTVLRPGGSAPVDGDGETNPGNPAMPVILSVNQKSVTSDVNGLVSTTPSSGSFSPPVEVDLAAATGTSATLEVVLPVLPPPVAANKTNARATGRPPARVQLPVAIRKAGSKTP